ncbi:MAG: hypothetical protein ACI8S6_000946 [Myxococcota bacterium]|jgi:hypothetical protein
MVLATISAILSTASIDDARLVTWTWEDTALALSADAAELEALLAATPGLVPEPMSTDGGEYVRYTLPVERLDGVSRGSRWRLLSAEEGEQQCSVSGFGMIMSPGFSLSDRGSWGAPCAEPLLFAELDCGDEEAGWSAVAVPVALDKAQVGRATAEQVEVPVPTGPLAAVLREEAIQALRVEASSRAAEQGAVLQTMVWTRAVSLGGRSVSVVEGRFYTGAGEDFCGGEDVGEEWGGLLIDGVPQGLRPLPEGRILGVFDLDGDGAVEVLESSAEGRVLRGADGRVIRRHSSEWCVCGC